ncbi:MAG TPA: OmpA family protein [Thermoanaerobaculia bacterium]|jgi:outer membrane protein OmpA-like peptidoglycan-associated protein|nr:OmpA family protein [Thermoanaerobaculia bacterium]
MRITKIELIALPIKALAILLAFALAACSAGPPPTQIADARLALEEARRAHAEELATRPYDEAVRHLSVAESTWEQKKDAATAAHWARRAEAAAREAQFQAEVRTAEEEIRRETERRNRAEIAVRDAEIARLQGEARTEAERRAAEAEALARREQRRREEEQERRELATEEARREAEARQETEARAREERQRLEEELARRDSAAEQERQRLEEQRRAGEARAAELDRLREEQQRTREELRATLSRLADVRQEERGLVVTLPGSIYFEVNKAVIQPAMRSRLTEIARAMAAAGDSAILIEGHTDSDGSNEYNLELSRLRAEAVRSVLVAGGVPPDRVQTLGYGETKPIASNASASGKAQNRRVEIVLQGSSVARTP